jgi:hypothetical protein
MEVGRVDPSADGHGGKKQHDELHPDHLITFFLFRLGSQVPPHFEQTQTSQRVRGRPNFFGTFGLRPLLTACLLTPSSAAISAWVRPLAARAWAVVTAFP